MANVTLTTEILRKGIQDIFEGVYADFGNKLVQLVYIKKGRYEIWQGNKRLVKRIKHRKQALAMVKLIQGE
jgi:hypothetical protein